ncbi:hypothetical protein Lgee_0612 [Legionella geestiana]|uniref:Uncharacterized protein n=1 Tax=Legionella geestiana TaxID=45065 RepID=A0A0W0U5J8_9GAMM|nr:hypothetical protein [Legionella geestiana]KTD02877.1 hypothetical protein Lgee_0612 [Legionella geestiana]QBS11686.1 hypothetical protein E4T54_02425 [Legionella geestiana]QDQ40703.1 hypothetical protein E3226_009995 [Legionella geestiana]STX53627.1 Uncharacterised protein [Legionella geestiana]
MPSNANGFFEGSGEKTSASRPWSPTIERLKRPPVDCDGLGIAINPPRQKPSLSEVLAPAVTTTQGVEVDARHAPDRSPALNAAMT